MMNLQEVKAAVDHLSPEERAELRTYLDQYHEQVAPVHTLSAEERIRRLDEAARAIREGFTDEEWEAIEQAMNEEFVEAVDEDVWKD